MESLRAGSLVCGSWDKCYWFARMLVNTDKYAAPGRSVRFMNDILSVLEGLPQSYELRRSALMHELDVFSEGTSKSALLRRNFRNDIDNMIASPDDIAVFIFTVKHILLPTNSALNSIPNDDKAFCRSQAVKLLDELGRSGVAQVLASWDSLGVRECLRIEREVMVNAFMKLREALKAFALSPIDEGQVLTAFIHKLEPLARGVGGAKHN